MKEYIPAAKFYWLTPLYDPLVKLAMPEHLFRQRIVEQAKLRPGMKVLDIGCGTGSMDILIKQLAPQTDVTGLDGDPQVLEIARNKAAKANLNIQFEIGFSYKLPYGESQFDRVFSSMMFHHLNQGNKLLTLKEIHRVLKPGGEFDLVDFGAPGSFSARVCALIMRQLEELDDNLQGKIPGYISSAGFTQVDDMGRVNTTLGTLQYYRAIK